MGPFHRAQSANKISVPGEAVRVAGHMSSFISGSEYYTLQDLNLIGRQEKSVLCDFNRVVLNF